MTFFSCHRILKLVAVICLPFASSVVYAQQTVKIIPTIHKLHVVNVKYNYDSLREIVAELEPTLIAVEMRNEDLKLDSNYLKRNYPYEMWMMKYWFPNLTIVGFDWLGPGLEGRQIPENYWKEQSDIKKWERLLAEDTSFNSKIEECDSFTHLRMNLLQSLSFSQLLKSNDSSLTVAYY
jgi:hypothetical protein